MKWHQLKGRKLSKNLRKGEEKEKGCIIMQRFDPTSCSRRKYEWMWEKLASKAYNILNSEEAFKHQAITSHAMQPSSASIKTNIKIQGALIAIPKQRFLIYNKKANLEKSL